MMEKNITFFDDRPIDDFSKDWMWKDDLSTDANRQIMEIAQRIMRPLVAPDELSESLTFAIHGRWGSGKTSFVKLIIARARQLLREQNIDENRLVFCEFNASSLQMSGQPARASMAMQVLLALAESTMETSQNQDQLEDVKSKALRIFSSRAYKQNIGIEDIVDKNQPVFERITRINKYLEQVSEELAGSQGFCDIIQAELAGQSDGPHAMTERALVVFIDDLDRCHKEYVTEILDVIQQWGMTKRLYFVLAIDRYILDVIIRDYYGDIIGDKDESKNQIAIEKYVQHSFEIPELNEDGVKRYITALFKDYTETPLAQVLLRNIPLFTASLRIRTPRSVKRCINTIRLPLENLGRSTESKEKNIETSLEQILKEELLKYTWREFYHIFFLPADKRIAQFYSAFLALERAATVYLAGGDIQLYNFELNRIRQRLEVGEDVIPSDYLLASFLGNEPWFFLTREMLQVDASTLLLGIASADTPEKTLDGQQLLSKAPSRRFQELYSQYQNIDYEANPEEFMELAIEMYRLVRANFHALPKGDGPRLGNVALRVEALLMDYGNTELQAVALGIYELSYRLNPRHANNNCNFASFIIDAQIPPLNDLYEFAYSEVLGEDEELYLSASKLDRFYLHRAELAYKMFGLQEQVLNNLSHLVDLATSNSNGEVLLRALQFVRKYDVSDQQSIQLLVKPIMTVTSERLQNLCLKGLADAFSDSLNGCELYRFILQRDNKNALGDKELLADTKHNYAVNLAGLGYRQEALDLWYDAYHIYVNEIGSPDSNIAGALSAFIDEYCNEKDLQSIVQEGKPLPAKPTLSVSSPVIPEQFIPGGIRAILGDFAT